MMVSLPIDCCVAKKLLEFLSSSGDLMAALDLKHEFFMFLVKVEKQFC